MSAAQSPLVSVVVPNYNCGRFLVRTLESVFSQSYANLEVVVVDDESTDDSLEVLAGYGDRIRVVRQRNQGVSVARNRGIQESRGELIAFLDADDEWHPEKLARQVPLFADERVGLVHCGVEYIDENGRPLGTNLTGRRGTVLEDCALLRGTVVLAGGSTAVVRRRCFDRAGGFDPELSTAADWDMWRRIACHEAIDMVREPLMRYRLRPGSMHRNLAVFEHDMLHGFRSMFADPAAAAVHHLRRPAYARLYLMLAGSYLHDRRWRPALGYAVRAVALNPGSLGYILGMPLRRLRRSRGDVHDMEPTL
ncbi:MAG: glycosyltransferase family 2 protein [Vicinamibacterales bacterium]